jgi:hypothetical protein
MSMTSEYVATICDFIRDASTPYMVVDKTGASLFGYFAICVGGLLSGHAWHPPDVVV